MRSKLSILLLLFLSFSLGITLGRQSYPATTQIPSPNPGSESTSQIIQIQDYPECILGLCPEYQSMDVDDDDYSESVIIIPTAMTQGSGKVWIIDNGKKVFESDEHMRINIAQTETQQIEGNGFTLTYGTKVNSSDDGVADTYKYTNGTFIKL